MLYGYEPISTPEVMEKLSNKSDWKPNTIHTMLARLIKNGLYTQEKMAEVAQKKLHKESSVLQASPAILYY